MSVDVHTPIVLLTESLYIRILIPIQRIVHCASRAVRQETSSVCPRSVSRIVQVGRGIQPLHEGLRRGNQVWSIQRLNIKLVWVQARLRHFHQGTDAQASRSGRFINVSASEVPAQLGHLLRAQRGEDLCPRANPRRALAGADKRYSPVRVDFISKSLGLDGPRRNGSSEVER